MTIDHPTSPPESALAASWWETRQMLKLALPLVLTQLAHMTIITTDMIFLGRLGPDVLATTSLAGNLFFLFYTLSVGVLGSIAPILAQHIGARRFRQVRPTTRHGFWLALVMGLPIMAVLYQTDALLQWFGQDPKLSAGAQSYIRILVLGLIPGLWLFVLNEFLAAHGRPRAMTIVILVGIGFNALADYTFIFGNFGFPALGIVGAGIASASVNTLMFLALFVYVLTDKRFRRYRLFGRFWKSDWPQLVEILKVGLPISIADVAEIGMFVAATFLMGMVGTDALAAHSVAIQIAALAFMVSLGIGQAAAVRVGWAVGRKDYRGAARAGYIAQAISVGYSLLPMTVMALFGLQLTGIYLDLDKPENQAAIRLSVSLMTIAAFFQLADGLQATARGSLRGLKDTRVPMLITVTGYWGLGLTSAAMFGLFWGFGSKGIWWSLAIGLAVVGILLHIRFRRQTRRLIRDAREEPVQTAAQAAPKLSSNTATQPLS